MERQIQKGLERLPSLDDFFGQMHHENRGAQGSKGVSPGYACMFIQANKKAGRERGKPKANHFPVDVHVCLPKGPPQPKVVRSYLMEYRARS